MSVVQGIQDVRFRQIVEFIQRLDFGLSLNNQIRPQADCNEPAVRELLDVSSQDERLRSALILEHAQS